MAKAPFDIGTYIEVDPAWHDGWPYVRGTRKTVASVGVMYSSGLSAEEIAQEKYMTLPEVHAALCYYLANREGIDAVVAAYDAETDRLASASRE